MTRISTIFVLSGALAALALSANVASAEAVNVHTTVPTIKPLPPPKVNPAGTKHFEIKDFSFGVENPTTVGSATGGAGSGKIKFNEFPIKKTTDSAPPKLNTVNGPKGKTGNSGQNNKPKEEVQSEYGKLGIQYEQQNPQGSGGGIKINPVAVPIGSQSSGSGAGK